MFARALRSETRSRARDDSRRFHRSTEKVQRWEKKWVPIKDTSMMVYKWVPISESEAVPMKKSGFARAQANILAPTGGSIISISSRPPELRTEHSPPIVNTTAEKPPETEQTNETSNDAESRDLEDSSKPDAQVELTSA